MRHSPHQLISGRVRARTKVPHATLRGVQGSKGNGTILNRGILQPSALPGHTFALDLTNSSSSIDYRLSRFAGSSSLENGTLRYHAGLQVAPQGHQQLARQGHDGDAPDAALDGADPLAEPDAQGAVGLVAQPQPGKFHHGGASLAIAGLADSLLARHAAALERARRKADVAAQLSTIIKVAIEHLADQHRRKLRPDRLELMESLNLLGVDAPTPGRAQSRRAPPQGRRSSPAPVRGAVIPVRSPLSAVPATPRPGRCATAPARP